MHPSARPGFTLVELLVAVVLIDVGVLALVAGSAVVVRRQTELRVRSVAERTAANRIQTLAAGRCIAVSGGAAHGGGMVEQWAAIPRANGTRELTDSVRFSIGRVQSSVVLRTLLAC